GGPPRGDAQREEGPGPLPRRLRALAELARPGARRPRADKRPLAEVRRRLRGAVRERLAEAPGAVGVRRRRPDRLGHVAVGGRVPRHAGPAPRLAGRGRLPAAADGRPAYGADGRLVAATSLSEAGCLGKLGLLPGWPGEDVYPPQPMVGQTREVLERYAAAGGRYREVRFEECGHTPYIENPERFMAEFTAVLAEGDAALG